MPRLAYNERRQAPAIAFGRMPIIQGNPMKKVHRASALLCFALLAAISGCATQGGGQARPKVQAGTSLSMSQSDLRLLADLAQTNIAEVQTGQLALSRTQDPRIKTFAQSIVDEHGKALQELQQLAASNGLQLPEGADLVHRAVAADLAQLSGVEFDQQYLSMFGIADHKSFLGLLDQAARAAASPALRTYAQKLLPTEARHLERAQQLAPGQQ